jgi:hypothetical protein
VIDVCVLQAEVGKRETGVLSMVVSFSGKYVFYLFCEAHRSYVGINFVTTGM